MDAKERVQALSKYEWVFNQFLRSGECQMGNLGEMQEVNSHHLALFGHEADLTCNDCRGHMMRAVGQWYFAAKNSIINE